MQYFINMKVSTKDLLLGLGCLTLHGGRLLKGPRKLLLEVMRGIRDKL
jgi:hypothetical protein